MKIAIPTDDGINVAPDFDSAKGCLIITLTLNEIVQEDLRWKTDNIGVSSDQLCSAISDCSILIIRRMNQTSKLTFLEKTVTIVQTTEKIITNAIVHYLEHEFLEASNTCCCP